MSRKRGDSSVVTDAPRTKKRHVDPENDDEVDYEGATQEVIQEITDLLKNHVRSGKIQKIILKNFMCHSHLLVDFNKRVNLLVGNNGSGKSAVLTALIIGLGSNARLSDRSSNLKQLVKNGESSGSIEIHISNDGIDSYNQKSFGKKIIVIRTLTISGSTTFKLKDESGHVISSTKSDLKQMTLFLNIQVDNPVCVLTQDKARSFLKDSDPKKQYELFLKATQIDAIIEKLNDCGHHFVSAKEQLKFQQKGIEIMKKELANTAEKYVKLQSVETLKTDVETYKNELNWSLVKHCEDEIEKLKSVLKGLATSLNGLMEEVKSRDGTKEKISEKISDINSQIAEFRTLYDTEGEKYEKQRQELVKVTEETSIQGRNVRKIESQKNRIINDVVQIESTLAERNDSYANNVQKQKQANEQQIKEFGSKNTELISMLENMQRDVDMYLNTINQESDLLENNGAKKSNIVNKMQQLKVQIRQIDHSVQDSLSVYHRDMPNLVARIKQLTSKGKFSKLPRGPLGHFVQVPDKKWRPVIEQMIGRHLRSFCVNTDSDRVELDTLLRKEFPQMKSSITIITAKFMDKVYDVSRGCVRPVQNSNTMMNQMKVSDPVVMNCLIDQLRIETVLLVEDPTLATRLTSDEENIPQNMSKVILLKPLSEIFPAPAYRSYAMDVRPGRFIQVNTAELKMQYNAELQENELKVAAVEEELKASETKIAILRKKLVERQEQLKRMKAERMQLMEKIRELKSIEYPSEHDNELLQNELMELKASIEGIEEKLRIESNKLQTLEEKEQEKEAKISMYKTKRKQIEVEIQKLQEQHDAERTKLLNLDENKKYQEDLLKTCSSELDGKKGEFEKKKKDHLVISGQAAQYGMRVESKHTAVELNKIIKDMEKRIRTICSSKENINDVKILLDSQQEKLNLSNSVIEILSKTLNTLHKAREQRFMYIVRLKDHMALRVKHKFSVLMALRNAIGEVKIDHQNKKLELSVVPRDKNISNAVSNTKSLSGGERSYSTVAFLISLWKCIDHPFYFLDEYDVFTDQVNRHVMTKLLLDEAKTKPDRQYAFLTPQDMSAIESNEMITIHKMADPVTC